MKNLNLYKIGSFCENNQNCQNIDIKCDCKGKKCLLCENYDYYSIYSEFKEIKYLNSEPAKEIKDSKVIDLFYHASGEIDKRCNNTVNLDFKVYKMGIKDIYCKYW
jgi:hypothetical protein